MRSCASSSATTATAGHRVHDRGGPPLHAADPQRQATRSGCRPLRRRRGRTRGCSTRRCAIRRSTPPRSTRCFTPLRSRRRSSGRARRRGSPPAPPRARSSSVRPAAADAAERRGRDPRAPVHRGRRCRRLPRGPGILTSEGGKASHAALVARGMGRPCVSRRGRSRSISQRKIARIGDVACAPATRSRSTARPATSRSTTCRSSAGGHRRLPDGPRVGRRAARRSAYAPTPTRPRTPHRSHVGAKGIGLCRTEHMFLATASR